jgi:hypothetical protein
MKTLPIATAALLLGYAGTVSAATINFGDLEPGTVVSNQFAGVSFSIDGGPGPDGSPVADFAFGENQSVELLNSSTNGYPSSANLNIIFTAPASNVSFRFNNYGNPEGADARGGLGFIASSMNGLGDGFSTWTAYGSSNNVLGTANIWFTTPYDLINVGSGVKRLVISNGSNGQGSWVFGVSQLSFNPVPEPGTWMLMILGFGAVGVSLRRRQTAAA